MEQHDIHTFLLRFFKANQCSILEESAGHMTVQLTIEMDKLIMNRPFFIGTGLKKLAVYLNRGN
ncbi:hypothetical protein BsIDN1_43020 [Bacillus safensis]|uniref:Uncharacterized protein n=1 Tax=Bacillus safensis TaxID=561879 RepID=A0A5S9MEW7_BACIA|nr:hypothetical protein BsIDN1_43020 [Bacillus safensis]